METIDRSAATGFTMGISQTARVRSRTRSRRRIAFVERSQESRHRRLRRVEPNPTESVTTDLAPTTVHAVQLKLELGFDSRQYAPTSIADPFECALASARIDDEPYTDEQRAYANAGWNDYLRGDTVSLEEATRLISGELDQTPSIR